MENISCMRFKYLGEFLTEIGDTYTDKTERSSASAAPQETTADPQIHIDLRVVDIYKGFPRYPGRLKIR